MLIGILIGILIICALMGLFLLAPFLKTRGAQIRVLVILAIVGLVILVIPNSLIMGIKLPFINDTIENFTISFLSLSGHYGDLIKFDSSIESNIINNVAKVIKGCTILICMSLTMFITTIVLFIISLVKKNGKKAKVFFSSLSLLVLSLVILVSPMYSTVQIYTSINKNLAKKNSTLLETYPKYKKYEKILKVLDDISDNVNTEYAFFDILGYPMDVASLGGYSALTGEMASVDKHLNRLKTSGITIIYTDKTFDFTKTTKDTFNFDEMIALVKDVNHSKLYGDLALTFTNQILASFETKIANDSNKEGLKLQMSKEEFVDQYRRILELLEFVVEYDLVNRINNLSLEGILQLAGDLGLDILTLPNFSSYPIINKVKAHMGYATDIAAAIYTCGRLYDAMNLWLNNFRQTSLYNTSDSFLHDRGII